MAAADYRWLLMAIDGYCWLLLAVDGCCGSSSDDGGGGGRGGFIYGGGQVPVPEWYFQAANGKGRPQNRNDEKRVEGARMEPPTPTSALTRIAPSGPLLDSCGRGSTGPPTAQAIHIEKRKQSISKEKQSVRSCRLRELVLRASP